MEIKMTLTGIKEAREAASPERLRRAIARALAKTVSQGKTAATKAIREEYNIKQRDLASKIRTEIDPSRLQAAITVSGRNIPLLQFGARQTKKGVTLQIKKGSRKVLRSSFISTMRSGHQGVFSRTTRKRLPIKELYSLGAAQMFGSRKVMEAVKDRIREQWDKNIQHELTQGWRYGKQ